MNADEPQQFLFEDDGVIPNSNLPLLYYQNAFGKRGREGARWLEETFQQNNWLNSWRDGVFLYHHYHSTAHEVLGIYSGSANLQLGGEQGKKMKVEAGDVIIIPAGVAHKNLDSSADFGVVGAYPNGRSHDMNTGKEEERPQADMNIAELSVPETDPLLGKEAGLSRIWSG